MVCEDGSDILLLHDVLEQIAKEDPSLHLTFDETSKQIHISIMGEIQKEVLQRKIYQKSGIKVGFEPQGIIYHETIAQPVIGVGHFEPLRHYAEVVVKIEPKESGNGVEVTSQVVNGSLSSAFERSILQALHKPHRGVLTGAYLTDVKITLLAGKGSLKHTTGGDFLQAAKRAVRQGLMKATSILLEPKVKFYLTVPTSVLSRALFDLDQKECTFEIVESDEISQIEGVGPLRLLQNYAIELNAYSHGAGRFSMVPDANLPVKNQEEIILQKHYDPLLDIRNPVGSVFCANGTGYYVEWDQVEEHMHIEMKKDSVQGGYRHERMHVGNDDMENILQQASFRNRNDKKVVKPKKKVDKDENEKVVIKPTINKPKLYLIDGYNCLYAWEYFASYENETLAVARDKLIDLFFRYLPYVDCPMILVFDGYKRKDNAGSSEKKGSLEIVYTKTEVTADAYIEKFMYDHPKEYDLTVITSDALIQNAVLAYGARRMSAREAETQLKLKGVI